MYYLEEVYVLQLLSPKESLKQLSIRKCLIILCPLSDPL